MTVVQFETPPFTLAEQVMLILVVRCRFRHALLHSAEPVAGIVATTDGVGWLTIDADAAHHAVPMMVDNALTDGDIAQLTAFVAEADDHSVTLFRAEWTNGNGAPPARRVAVGRVVGYGISARFERLPTD